MKCSICRTEMTYFTRDQEERSDSFWWRPYPEVVFCHVCWDGLDDLGDQLTRLMIARRLRAFRSEDKAKAHRFLDSLRGRGVPPNLKRLHKRRMNI